MNPPPGQPPVDPRGTLRPPGSPPAQPYTPFPSTPGPLPQAPQSMYAAAPVMPPPGWPPFPMPPRSAGGGGRGLLIGLLVVALALSLLVNLILVIALGLSGGPTPGQSVQRVVTAGNPAQTIAVIPVSGVILDDVEQQFAEDLETAERDARVKAIVLHLDSPGGTVTDAHQMYEALRLFRQRSGKPVVVHMDGVAASGGYFVACAADEIVAEESTITGSIGVLVSYPQLSEFAEKTGIRYQTLVADGSPRKNALDIWEPPSAEDLADVQALLNQQHELFRTIVQQGRSEALTSRGTTVDQVTNGQVWLGKEAQKLGLVDKVGFMTDALASAASRAGLANPHVVRYTRQPSLAEAFGLVRTPLEGATINLDAFDSAKMKRAAGRLLHELATPHSLYLYRGVQ